MDIRIQGSGPTGPFLSASDRFETEHDLQLPVQIRISDDPEERTKTSHRDGYHIMELSRAAATSAMATELAVHEFSHMRRYEEDHPSHTQSTQEAIYLALTGRSVEQQTLAHCYQIANHMKDIYADDLTLAVTKPDKLIRYLEAGLASALQDRPQASGRGSGTRITAQSDPTITAVNAAFALALIERHDLVSTDHRIYSLADAAAVDAPQVPIERFKQLFRSLAEDPAPGEYRQRLVEATRMYAGVRTMAGQAAD